MSLIDNVRETTAKLEKYQNLDAIRTQNQKQKTLKTKLDELTEEMNQIFCWLEALSDYADFNQIYPYLRDLQAVLIEHNAAYSETIQSENVKQLRSKTATLRRQCIEFWKKFAETRERPICEILELTKILNSAGADNDLKIIKNLKERAEKNPEDIHNFIKKVENVESTLEKLQLNSEVKRWLIKMGKNQATLEDLTPEIQEWIRSQNLTNRIRTVF